MPLTVEIPVIFANNANGAKHIFIDRQRLPNFLDLTPAETVALQKTGLLQEELSPKAARIKIDYQVLAREYRTRLESGEFDTRADLAKSLGVSRAWISKVMQRGSRASRDHRAI